MAWGPPMSVSTQPGLTTTQVMPRGARSIAKPRITMASLIPAQPSYMRPSLKTLSSIEAPRKMSQPIVVTLPHRLGKAEALRRLKASFSDAQPGGGGLFVVKNQWSGDHLDFRASVLGQNTTGTVDLAENRHASSATSMVAFAAGQQGKGVGREAGQAHAGEAEQALHYAKLTSC